MQIPRLFCPSTVHDASNFCLLLARLVPWLALSLTLAGCNEPSAPEDPSVQHPAKQPHHGNGSSEPSWLSREEDGQWRMPAKNYASTRYSRLEEINASNVGSLKLEWTFSTGATAGHESAPIAVDDTVYIISPYPNTVYALGLDGSKKWEYKPPTKQESQGLACCDVVNRGLVYDAGKLYFNTLDNHSVALDAKTGEELWKTRIGDLRLGETITMAPLVVKNRLLVGNSGGEMGVRGWLKALDTRTGKLLWTAYSTGPDKDVLIGEEFLPFYPKDSGKDLGEKTWPPELWRIGGGTVWGWISYDPEMDLIYYGTGNPGPWNHEMRPGDNKWTLAIFARRPETGKAVWAYQIEAHDLFDYDGVNENLLLDIPFKGRQRKVLVRPERNGYLYVLDRSSGEVLSAKPYTSVNVTHGVDLKTGEMRKIEKKAPETGKTASNICPAAPGGKDWQPSAYSPQTGFVYVPHNNLCMDLRATNVNYIAGTPYVGADVKMYAGPGGHRGAFTAWDPVNGRKVWSIEERFPVWSGALATAGNLVFYGTMDRMFRAVDARSGVVLWEHRVGSGIVGQPITFRGKGGKQYVAVMAGVGGWAGAVVSGGLDARDGTAALGFANAMKDLPQYTGKGGTLYVFALP